MRRMGLGILAAIVVALLVASVASAVPPNPLPDNQGTSQAKEKSPAIDDGDNVISPRESELSKIIFIRYAEGKGWGKGGNPNKATVLKVKSRVP